jgi:hypothetical protein
VADAASRLQNHRRQDTGPPIPETLRANATIVHKLPHTAIIAAIASTTDDCCSRFRHGVE